MTLEEKILEEFDSFLRCQKHERCPIKCDNGVTVAGARGILISAMHQIRKEEVEITRNAILQAKEGWIEEGRVSCPPHNMIPITSGFSWSPTAPAPTHKCTKCLLTESF